MAIPPVQRRRGSDPATGLVSRLLQSVAQQDDHGGDVMAHALIGWRMGAHTHSHVDTRSALHAVTCPIDLFAQRVAVIIVGESRVVWALQNPIGSVQGKRIPPPQGEVASCMCWLS